MKELITILGPTACGKTKLAVRLAHIFNGEIISADSRQVYRGMDLGTGKDLSDYKIENQQIKYHLIDIVDPSDEFNVFSFKQHFINSLKDIFSRGKLPFLVGGTGLYLSSVLQDYRLKKADFEKDFDTLNRLSNDELVMMLKEINPKLHNVTDLKNRERTIKAIIISRSNQNSLLIDKEIRNIVLGVRINREQIRKNITDRLKIRLKQGMIDEVKSLLDSGLPLSRMLNLGLEYKFIALYLNGELKYNDMFQKLNSAIHDFAKRQMTWFRKMEREGVVINWIDGPDFNKAKQLIENYL
ncbi:MAG: tRNA (adenosine(37)-N6)-dimethylallyltransferase MiaA [Ignavibacteriaceae bacterium]|nr:tRNA (adenosine(37)-N6)-dimethylallyltransferase MiaA [Ignavibacteriaceae bacterium]